MNGKAKNLKKFSFVVQDMVSFSMFSALSQNYEMRLLASYLSVRPSPCLSVCPSVRMEQLGSHWSLHTPSLLKTLPRIKTY
jgi:hypothetical protein